MAERRPREAGTSAPPGARRVKVGRLAPARGTLQAANDNRLALRARVRRVAYWTIVLAALGWIGWASL
jgi:hypothetical protein